MIEIAQVQNLLWAADVVGKIVLLIVLAVCTHHRLYPICFFYLLTTLAHDVVAFVTYQRWGFDSATAYRIAWGAQGIVLFARALAVAEVCRHLLSRSRGVWALAWRILLLCAVLVLSYSTLAARHDWRLALPSADRGLELSIASVIVVLLLFARYYGVKAEPVARSLAIGFCLYSCFAVLNNTMLERLLYDYSVFWNVLGMLAFLATLSIWTFALRHSESKAQAKEILLPTGLYLARAPEINLRLRLFNAQLSERWTAAAAA